MSTNIEDHSADVALISQQLQSKVNLSSSSDTASPSSFIPVKTNQVAFHINQVFTEFLYEQFTNLTLIRIGQLNKPGTIIRAVKDAYVDPSMESNMGGGGGHYGDDDNFDDDKNEGNRDEIVSSGGTFTIQILMGKRQSVDVDERSSEKEELIHVEYFIARRLIERLSLLNLPFISSLPILLCISLDKKFESRIQQMDNEARQLMNTVVDLALETIVKSPPLPRRK